MQQVPSSLPGAAGAWLTKPVHAARRHRVRQRHRCPQGHVPDPGPGAGPAVSFRHRQYE